MSGYQQRLPAGVAMIRIAGIVVALVGLSGCASGYYGFYGTGRLPTYQVGGQSIQTDISVDNGSSGVTVTPTVRYYVQPKRWSYP